MHTTQNYCSVPVWVFVVYHAWHNSVTQTQVCDEHQAKKSQEHIFHFVFKNFPHTYKGTQLETNTEDKQYEMEIIQPEV